jgi:hypothetical protein
MQNVRDYSTVKLHTSAKSALKAISNPTFKNYTILGDDLVQTNHFTQTITHDKPIAIGFSILELVIKNFLKEKNYFQTRLLNVVLKTRDGKIVSNYVSFFSE